MNYAYKIEAQRQRFYGSARAIMRRTLKEYSRQFLADVRKATTTSEIIRLSERQLPEKPVENGLRHVYQKTMPFFAEQAVKQLKPKKSAPETIETDYWQAYIDKFVRMRLAQRIKWITNFTEQVFKETTARIIDEAIKEGLGVDRIARMLEKELNISERYRSERIARTEVVSASNEGSLAGAKSTDLDLDKEWIAYIDDRTRDSHIELNGNTTGINETFSNGLEYPGDPAGDAEEVINCRCTIGYVVKESNFEFGRTLPD